jgi:acyl transferase domain-containing protein
MLAYRRGLLAAKVSKSGQHDGAMFSVRLSEHEVQSFIHKVTLHFGEQGLTVGCINSPENVTVTGLGPQVDTLISTLEKSSVFVRKLMVDVAYHSTQMEAIVDEYQLLNKDIKASVLTEEPPVMISSLTGSQISSKELLSGDYWSKNMTSPVKFSEALSNLCSHRTADGGSIDTLLEIGPHSSLKGPIREVLKAEAKGMHVSYNSFLVRNKSAVETTLNAIGLLYYSGSTEIDMAEVNQWGAKTRHHPMALADLPEYPFDHSRVYWHESRLSKDHRLGKKPRMDLLGTPVSD